jgi:methyl-accepting chemotaxis protein
VRSLAQRSAQSAKETATKIEEAVGRSEHGVQISGKVAENLGEIVEKARRVDELVGEIASASQEQTQGINQVSGAISQMDKVTQSNAANAEETASASEELSAQAEMMRESVRDLQQLVDGSTRDPALEDLRSTRPAALPASINKAVRPSAATSSVVPVPARLAARTNPPMPATNGADHAEFFN